MTELRKRKEKSSTSTPVSSGGPSVNKAKKEYLSKPPSTWDTIVNWKTAVAVVVSAIAALLLTHLFVKSPIDAVSFTLPDPPTLPDDNRLSKAEIFLQDQIFGPESLAIHPETGLIYTGLKTGLICEIEIKDNEAKILRALQLTSLKGCDGAYVNMEKCGRPLGMRFNEAGELIVVDAYLGVFAINWKKEKVHKLLSGGAQLEESNQPPIRYLNDLDFLPDGKIVLSESSTKFDDKDCLWDMLEHKPNGRILIFNPKTGTVNLLVDKLYFPNGVNVWRGKVIVSEMGLSRIIKISPSSKKVSVVVDNLPGYPDNIRRASDGKLWIPLAALRTPSDNWLAERPRLRELLTKVLSPQALVMITEMLSQPTSVIIKVDPETGTIDDTLIDESGKLLATTSVIEDSDGNLLLGNDANYLIAKLSWKNYKK